MKLSGIDWLTLVLVIIGGLNWGLIGLFEYNLITNVFGVGGLTKIIYIVFGLSALYILGVSKKLRR